MSNNYDDLEISDILKQKTGDGHYALAMAGGDDKHSHVIFSSKMDEEKDRYMIGSLLKIADVLAWQNGYGDKPEWWEEKQ